MLAQGVTSLALLGSSRRLLVVVGRAVPCLCHVPGRCALGWLFPASGQWCWRITRGALVAAVAALRVLLPVPLLARYAALVLP